MCVDYEASVDHYLRADRSAPKLPVNIIGLIAAYSLAGEIEAARDAANGLLQSFPEFKIDELVRLPFREESKRILIDRTLRPLVE